ncbi:MAG: hypothetical protein V3G42_10870 [Oscillospiraceae bacterium]
MNDRDIAKPKTGEDSGITNGMVADCNAIVLVTSATEGIYHKYMAAAGPSALPFDG